MLYQLRKNIGKWAGSLHAALLHRIKRQRNILALNSIEYILAADVFSHLQKQSI